MFKRVHVINLKRRPDRLKQFYERFPDSWPFERPEVAVGLDGDRVPVPPSFTQQGGAWACLRTHMRLYEEAIANNQSLFVFEDDCIFADDFEARVAPFFNSVPDNWGMIYLGGLHREPETHRPEQINEHVALGRAITGTYAYGINIRFLRMIYPMLWETRQHHIDQMIGRLMYQANWRVYCPLPWLVGMAEGYSDITGRFYQGKNYWELVSKEDAGKAVYINQVISRVRYKNDGTTEDVALRPTMEGTSV